MQNQNIFKMAKAMYKHAFKVSVLDFYRDINIAASKKPFWSTKEKFKTNKAYNEQKCYKLTKGLIKANILDFNTAKY